VGQLLYRFAGSTDAQLRADAAAVMKALHPRMIMEWGLGFTAHQSAGGKAVILEPFAAAVALAGLVVAMLIVGTVEAIASGRAPGTGRGHAVGRLAARLSLRRCWPLVPARRRPAGRSRRGVLWRA
jgi:F0F1-type ATP synthase membrane subunit c/vacuolar-type H+-ATPase subunit K